MAYKVELPPDLDNSLGGLSLPKNTGDHGDSGDRDTGLTEGRIIAVEIYSTLLDACIWLAFDDDFDPKNGQAVFYTYELAALKDKTPEQLRKIHALKLGAVGLRTKVRQ
jgi:hypothetical protein